MASKKTVTYYGFNAPDYALNVVTYELLDTMDMRDPDVRELWQTWDMLYSPNTQAVHTPLRSEKDHWVMIDRKTIPKNVMLSLALLNVNPKNIDL